MGKIFEKTINNFQGGIANDPRDSRPNVARVISNFDILTDKRRMKPYQDSEDGNSDAGNNKIQNFTIGDKEAADGTYVLYGLGVQTGAADAKIFYKEVLISGVNPDLSTATWTAATNGEQTTGDTLFNLFIYYKKTGKIYGARSGGRHIWSYDTSAQTFNESQQDLGATTTNIGQGLVHAKDDIMYFPVDNVIWKNDNDTFSAALTLPTHFKITSISEYGNDLAIACEPVSGSTPGFGGSVVYLWDRNSSLETLGENVDWGDEALKIIGEINGWLIGISVAAGSTWFDRRLVFRYLTGSRSVKFAEIISDAEILVNSTSQKHKNRLNFMMFITLNNVFRAGTWSVGGEPGNFTIVQERTLNNDTLFSISTLNLRPFHYVGDHLLQAYDIGGTFAMAKTTSATSFTATSIYETKNYATEGMSLKKSLVGFTIEHEPLASGEQVVIKYKIDEETSFSSAILTSATDNDVSASIPSSGAALPKDYKEVSFRIESTGGAVITGFSFKEEVTGKRNYD